LYNKKIYKIKTINIIKNIIQNDLTESIIEGKIKILIYKIKYKR